MNTTLLFAELLIVGTHAGIWVFLIALNVLGFTWLQGLQNLGLAEWQTGVAILLFTIFYVFGIIVDRLADLLFTGWSNKIKREITGDISGPLSTKAMIFQLNKDNEYLSHQFDYIRSRMRIARASALNFGLCTVLGLSLLMKYSLSDSSKYVLMILIAGSLLTLGAIYAWNNLTHTFYEIIKQNYPLQSGEQKTTQSNSSKSRKTSNL